LLELVIVPALQGIDLYCPSSAMLILATAAQETEDGLYIKQTVGGDKAALGIFEMQPQTHEDIWEHTIIPKSDLSFKISKCTGYPIKPKAEVMVYNLYYAAVMARCFWLFHGISFPQNLDVDDIWYLYKKYWNTIGGKATKEEFVSNYDNYVIGGLKNEHV
jgi:hypothetical protein